MRKQRVKPILLHARAINNSESGLKPTYDATSGRPQLKNGVCLNAEWKQVSDTQASRIKLKYTVKDNSKLCGRH